jgi:hypothetical protein
MSAAKKSEVVEPADAVFEIADESALKRGREAVPSVYHDKVKGAEVGKAYGIPAKTVEESTKVLNELRKAGNQTGLKLRTWNKWESDGYVAFKVVGPREVKTETVAEVAAAE